MNRELLKKREFFIVVAIIAVAVAVTLLIRDAGTYPNDFRNGVFIEQERALGLRAEERELAQRRLREYRELRTSRGALDAYLREAAALVDLGGNAEARDLLEEAKEVYAEEAEFFEATGDLLVQMRQYKDAARSYERAIALKPSLYTPYLSLVELYQNYSSVPEKAEAVYEQALKNGADTREVLINYASFVQIQKKDLARALELWTRAAEKARSESERKGIEIKIRELQEELGLPPEPGEPGEEG